MLHQIPWSQIYVMRWQGYSAKRPPEGAVTLCDNAHLPPRLLWRWKLCRAAQTSIGGRRAAASGRTGVRGSRRAKVGCWRPELTPWSGPGHWGTCADWTQSGKKNVVSIWNWNKDKWLVYSRCNKSYIWGRCQAGKNMTSLLRFSCRPT